VKAPAAWAAAALAAAVLTGCGGKAPRLATGPHAGLECRACHEEAGGKTVGFATDAACAACHAGELSSEVETAGISLPHRGHPGISGEARAACSACHTHAGPEADLAIDAGSCLLCHAELSPGAGGGPTATLPESGCAHCHPQPARAVFPGVGTPIDHAVVKERGVPCLQCHWDVTAGTGAVPDVVCRVCHGTGGAAAPLRGEPDRGAAVVHAQHFPDGEAPACARCHEAIDHEIGELASALVLDCADCHAPDDPALAAPVDSGAHRDQQLLYTGLVADVPEAFPAAKFLARVSCTDCHSAAATGQRGRRRLEAIESECLACHGERHRGILDEWARGASERTDTVGAYLRAAASDARVRRVAAAASSARLAAAAWELVQSANAVHNVPAADAILRRALGDAALAYRRAGVDPPDPPDLGPDPRAQTCARCHYAIDRPPAAVHGEPFSHRTHVIAAALACVECHSPEELLADGRTFDPAHGRTLVGPSDCRSCHHRTAGEVDCTSCHAAESLAAPQAATVQVTVGRRDTRSREAEFLHREHASTPCLACHREPAGIGTPPAVASCTDCHAEHHTADRDCAACHASEHLRSAHGPPVDAHRRCDACHDRATVAGFVPDGSFCRTCHDPGEDHYAASGLGCTECHFLAPAAAYRSELVGRGGDR
jgi:hypothetical protein